MISKGVRDSDAGEDSRVVRTDLFRRDSGMVGLILTDSKKRSDRQVSKVLELWRAFVVKFVS